MKTVKRRFPGTAQQKPGGGGVPGILKSLFFLTLFLGFAYVPVVFLAEGWSERHFGLGYLDVLRTAITEGPKVPLLVVIFLQLVCAVTVLANLLSITQPLRDWRLQIERFVFLGHGLNSETRFLCPDRPDWGVFTVFEGDLGRRRAQGFGRINRQFVYQLPTKDPRLASAYDFPVLRKLLVNGLLVGGLAFLFVLILSGGTLQMAYEAGVELTTLGQQRRAQTDSLALAFVIDHLYWLGLLLAASFAVAFVSSRSATRFRSAQAELMRCQGQLHRPLPDEIRPGAVVSGRMMEAMTLRETRGGKPAGSDSGLGVPNRGREYRLYNLEFDRGFDPPVLAGFYFRREVALSDLENHLDALVERQAETKVMVTEDLEILPLAPGESGPPLALLDQRSFDDY
ncbi:hypothetical protein [Pelagibius sp.]|uniref:hypothetical protein n=1 Tax=Pelagibius sp. TaxID=1931238 RepID=UPI00261C356A|nr:hypothetical protein [Pelagibius sp.]